MNKGIVFATAACFIWGLIYVVPHFMAGFTAIEVALGRYFFYGLISFLILAKTGIKHLLKYPLFVWKQAALLSLFSSIGYYTFVVLSMRDATPAICALVLGISPITIAFYGNLIQKECTFRSLILPSLLILIGLIVINISPLMESTTPSTYLFGLFYCLIALMAWTWYAVINARFLKEHTEIASSDWSTIIGIVTFCWVIISGVVIELCFADQIELSKLMVFDDSLMFFLGGSAILGVFCSWVGTYLWNVASVYLPVSLAGQLMVFETIFGLLFVYALEQRIPLITEMVGISLFLVAIFYGIRSMSVTTQDVQERHQMAQKNT